MKKIIGKWGYFWYKNIFKYIDKKIDSWELYKLKTWFTIGLSRVYGRSESKWDHDQIEFAEENLERLHNLKYYLVERYESR